MIEVMADIGFLFDAAAGETVVWQQGEASDDFFRRRSYHQEGSIKLS